MFQPQARPGPRPTWCTTRGSPARRPTTARRRRAGTPSQPPPPRIRSSWGWETIQEESTDCQVIIKCLIHVYWATSPLISSLFSGRWFITKWDRHQPSPQAEGQAWRGLRPRVRPHLYEHGLGHAVGLALRGGLRGGGQPPQPGSGLQLPDSGSRED